MNRKQRKDVEIMLSMEEIMDIDLPEDEFEELTGINLDEPDDYPDLDEVEDEISSTDLLDAEIEAMGLNPRRMEDVEKYFKMKESDN